MDANAVAQEEALANPKMEFRWSTVVDHYEGDGRLERVVLRNTKKNALEVIEADRCFYFVGYLPKTQLFKGQVALTDRGYIPTDVTTQTNVEGVFAVGDVRQTCLRQVATAVGDGATAGDEAERYIAEIGIFEKQLMQKEKPGLIYVDSAIDETSRALLPMVQEIERRHGGRIKLNRVDTYKSICLAPRLGAAQPPSFVFTEDGRVVTRSSRLERKAIIEILDGLLGTEALAGA
jgi:thioredoxin reductase (NADPH)